MRARIGFLFVGILLSVVIAAGCKAVDESAVASISSLTAAQPEADAVDTITTSRESVDDESVVMASSQIAPRKAIRTLQEGEDLGELVGRSPGVVLLDFYADWCGPCRKQSSELHELEDFALEVNAQIIKVNVDEHRALANEYRVSSLPTLLTVKDGMVQERKQGFTKRDQVKAMLR